LEDFQWWIVPHANPDGEKVNRSWYTDSDEQIDLIAYLKHVKREMPGDDVEFGFPRDPADRDARPENKCIAAWWMKAQSDFHLHVSLHGMAFSGGPFFLIEPAWSSRCEELKAKCRHTVEALGYRLHDVDRQGEKGFSRLEKGFATRPDSKAMTQYFLDRQDEVTASKFRPSSMETICSLGGDPLTLVTEMPLFLLPKVGEVLGPPDPEAERWKSRIEKWKVHLRSDRSEADPVMEEAFRQGLAAMPIRDQMQLQWDFIVAGLEQVQR
ncbi:MAG: peptidase, partial [Acidobacteria bacterium]|nr:peptidase [Acidobacteriota bacterium]